MAFLDNNGVGTLWGRIKTVFGASFADLVKDSSSVTIKLQNGYDNDLDTVAIPLVDSTSNTAGLMSPTDKSTLDSLNSKMPSYSSSNTKKVVWGNGAIEAINFKSNAGTDDVPVQLYKGSTTGTPLYTAFSVPSASTTTAGVMTPADKVKLNGIASGAEVNVQADWNQTTTTADDYIKNKPTIPSPGTGTSYPVMDGTQALGTQEGYARVDHVHPTDTSRASASHTHGYITNDGKISSSGSITVASGDQLMVVDHSEGDKIGKATISFDGATTTQALTKKGTWATFVKDDNYVHTDNNYTTADKTKVGYVDTGKSVSTYVSEQISSAMTGSAKYKGTVGTGGTVTTLPTSGYKQGDYYVVCTAGTYAGESCEVGDMIFANKDYASGATAADDWDIVQANITAMTTAEINAICV